jgi:hypothetical protein
MKNLVTKFIFLFNFLFVFFLIISCGNSRKENDTLIIVEPKLDSIKKIIPTTLDTVDYNKRMLALSNFDTSGKWPVKGPYPHKGAILPYNRIIAYYGNLYSKRMGILGELPKEQMLLQLKNEVLKWKLADSTVKTIPALHYIAITAQSKSRKDNSYHLHMPFKQIDTIISWAKSINALVFLDVQVGHGDILTEVKTLDKYLVLPNVHLAIDPEFSMKNGKVPGTVIGTFSAEDINGVTNHLVDLVSKNGIPPKVFIIHRFTQNMITDYKNIKKTPEVQLVINMDGFGSKVLKKSTYNAYIYREPIQFTGFKLFYKNDTKHNPNGLFTPEEILKLKPIPIYIQYQ